MGGYNGTQFLCDVEVYDPVKDQWEDGIALTSGRSGLASAVIYQPSCINSFMDCYPANQSTNREYDDDRKPPDYDQFEKKYGSDLGNAGTSNLHHSSHYFNACGNSKKCLMERELTVHNELIPKNPNINATDSSFKCTMDNVENMDNNLFNEDQMLLSHCPIAKLKAKFNRFILGMIKLRRVKNAERLRNCKTSETISSKCIFKCKKDPI